MTTIAGRYQPLEAARPGMPLRVRDLQTAQTLLLREASCRPEEMAAAFSRARTSMGIFHPALVTLFDVLEPAEGRLRLAYEYVAAQPAGVVSGGSPLKMQRAVELVAEVADAVAELHARDVVHGGISLTTVLVTLKGKAKLDRVGDPSLVTHPPVPADDLAALGDLLDALAGRPRGGGAGVVGAQGLDTLIARARAGRFESAATFAALLRRL